VFPVPEGPANRYVPASWSLSSDLRSAIIAGSSPNREEKGMGQLLRVARCVLRVKSTDPDTQHATRFHHSVGVPRIVVSPSEASRRSAWMAAMQPEPAAVTA